MTFDGFASDAPIIPLPQALLHDLVPQISDPAELIVTLYACAAIAQQRRYPRSVSASTLRETRPLIEALDSLCQPRPVSAAFEDGLNAAVDRGTLLRGQLVSRGQWSERLALNDQDGRRAMSAPTVSAKTVESELLSGRSPSGGIAALWEEALGTPLPAILADEVAAAEARFGAEPLRDALREAAANNARNWRYVRAILDRWEREGRDERDQAAGFAAPGLETSRYRHLFKD